jgi:hypothetical protein
MSRTSASRRNCSPLGFLSRWLAPARRQPRRPRRPLALEALEERSLPSTFTVLNVNDSGAGSLRAAVASAAADGGPDTIVFDPSLSRQTISLTSGELRSRPT